jgi:DNA-binding Xre family transcriptional regulator
MISPCWRLATVRCSLHRMARPGQVTRLRRRRLVTAPRSQQLFSSDFRGRLRFPVERSTDGDPGKRGSPSTFEAPLGTRAQARCWGSHTSTYCSRLPGMPRRPRQPQPRPLFVRIRTLRKSAGWTLAQLVERSGVSRATIVRLEGERTKGVDFDTLDRIAQVFSVDPGSLIMRKR